jgi:GT2 family glycosyltransferase
MYSEEIDLCYKIFSLGYKNIFIKNNYVYHHGGGSTTGSKKKNTSTVIMKNSRYKYFLKHRGYIYANLYRTAIVFIATARLIILVSVSPFCLIGNYNALHNSINKWFQILKWGIGLGSWIQTHIPI